ncbi:heavy-metal-associated domain-containing protein [Daejeonella sp.]|uniref:heavy-metal-associated domain-containing protein n=1 Tax=Daejeonella sp. TaxID=2805397 RepID=UPI003982F47B
MNKLKFKTNIKCTGCLSVMTPILNNLAGENNWNVDLDNPQKILTVEANISEGEIIDTIVKSGFEAEKV